MMIMMRERVGKASLNVGETILNRPVLHAIDEVDISLPDHKSKEQRQPVGPLPKGSRNGQQQVEATNEPQGGDHNHQGGS